MGISANYLLPNCRMVPFSSLLVCVLVFLGHAREFWPVGKKEFILRRWGKLCLGIVYMFWRLRKEPTRKSFSIVWSWLQLELKKYSYAIFMCASGEWRTSFSRFTDILVSFIWHEEYGAKETKEPITPSWTHYRQLRLRFKPIEQTTIIKDQLKIIIWIQM